MAGLQGVLVELDPGEKPRCRQIWRWIGGWHPQAQAVLRERSLAVTSMAQGSDQKK